MHLGRETFTNAAVYLIINGLLMVMAGFSFDFLMSSDIGMSTVIPIFGGIAELIIGLVGLKFLRSRSAVRFMSMTFIILGLWYVALSLKQQDNHEGFINMIISAAIMFMGLGYTITGNRKLKLAGMVVMGLNAGFCVFAMIVNTMGGFTKELPSTLIFTLLIVQIIVTMALSEDAEPRHRKGDGSADRDMSGLEDTYAEGKQSDDMSD